MSAPNVVLALLAAVIYAVLGYAASGEDFDAKKFLRTVLLAALVATGLSLGEFLDERLVYVWLTTPLAITVWLNKLLQSFHTRS